MTILFLNSIGTGELIFVLLVVLILFGSKSLPSLAQGLGKTMREIKGATDEIRQDIQNSAMEIRKDMDFDLKMDIDNPFKDIKKQIETIDEPIEFRSDNPSTTIKAPDSIKAQEVKAQEIKAKESIKADETAQPTEQKTKSTEEL
ncbi:twin-arginine translocase TatA/TatE family subunit [Crocinitomix catalasitica]|uniref:twin-arginine translocase TatA/TatE family subunit n=1 Tax=Crocinitomix catalasitica TaxID=184607 RepID=UPI0006877181|nr:twin-arginine translocase TatA/TatE family subunit [Crocinitomix catalasitica]